MRYVLETFGSERSESGMFCVEESGVVVESALKISEMVDGLCRPMSRKRDCKKKMIFNVNIPHAHKD